MNFIFQKIRELTEINSLSKNEQLIQGILNAIDEKLVSKGEILPSVNAMIKEFGFARETIAKAYKELINRGIIKSTNRLGYFVAIEDTEQILKVALVLFNFDVFQEDLYRNFKDGLGENVHLDIFFHHNNIETFESILSNMKGKYGMYVIAPIPHPKTTELLKSIPSNRLLMIDRYVPVDEEVSYIVQEFEEPAYQAFASLSERIKAFEEIIFFFKPSSAEPIDILKAFKRFLKDFDVKGTVKTAYAPGSVKAGKVYFTINNSELWVIIKDTIAKNLQLGKDVGILSHNDDTVKEIVCNGITTFSVNFGEMGKKAAEFVLDRQKIQEVMPTLLLRRNSL
jgi:DNA-binding LacI/PurR family transcriptional regulator